MKEVRGNGARVLAIFSDPDCPYCQKLETDLRALTNVTIYTFLMPLVSLHPAAHSKAVSVWCAKDRTAAWHATMWRGEAVPQADCPHPVDRNVALGERLGINGTPTLIASDGRMLPGAASKEQIEAWLLRSAVSAQGDASSRRSSPDEPEHAHDVAPMSLALGSSPPPRHWRPRSSCRLRLLPVRRRGQEGYACKAPIGAQCTSVSGVYANATPMAHRAVYEALRQQQAQLATRPVATPSPKTQASTTPGASTAPASAPSTSAAPTPPRRRCARRPAWCVCGSLPGKTPTAICTMRPSSTSWSTPGAG
jgi:hypothetical protein